MKRKRLDGSESIHHGEEYSFPIETSRRHSNDSFNTPNNDSVSLDTVSAPTFIEHPLLNVNLERAIDLPHVLQDTESRSKDDAITLSRTNEINHAFLTLLPNQNLSYEAMDLSMKLFAPRKHFHTVIFPSLAQFDLTSNAKTNKEMPRNVPASSQDQKTIQALKQTATIAGSHLTKNVNSSWHVFIEVCKTRQDLCDSGLVAIARGVYLMFHASIQPKIDCDLWRDLLYIGIKTHALHHTVRVPEADIIAWRKLYDSEKQLPKLGPTLAGFLNTTPVQYEEDGWGAEAKTKYLKDHHKLPREAQHDVVTMKTIQGLFSAMTKTTAELLLKVQGEEKGQRQELRKYRQLYHDSIARVDQEPLFEELRSFMESAIVKAEDEGWELIERCAPLRLQRKALQNVEKVLGERILQLSSQVSVSKDGVSHILGSLGCAMDILKEMEADFD